MIFEGTVRDYFWSPKFIPPILENAIMEMLNWTAESCQKANLNPELYIKETAIELQLGLVNYIYDHMVHLDQVFRSKGNRKSVKRVEVYDDKVPKMHKLVEQYAAAVNLISVAPKETATAQAKQDIPPAKRWWIPTCFGKIIEKGLYIFTKSFWDSVLERWGPKQ